MSLGLLDNKLDNKTTRLFKVAISYWCGGGVSTDASSVSAAAYRAVQNPQLFRPLRLTFVWSCSIQYRAVGGHWWTTWSLSSWTLANDKPDMAGVSMSGCGGRA
jgi:hypothetical protein